MKPYPKIDSVFKRDPATNYKTFTSDYADPAFSQLADSTWIWREKIHGTNIRIIYDPVGDVPLNMIDISQRPFLISGRKAKSQVPSFLADALFERLSERAFENKFGDTPVCLYGEGIGPKIQEDGDKYRIDNYDFILFDVRIDGWWLSDADVGDIGQTVGFEPAPEIGRGSLAEAMKLVKKGFPSQVSEKPLTAEGLILVPEIPLKKRDGSRVITKLKHKDFKHD